MATMSRTVAGSRAVATAFQPHMHTRGQAQCLELIIPQKSVGERPAGVKTETASCVDRFKFDWHVVYEYADGVKGTLLCRQMDNCSNDVSDSGLRINGNQWPMSAPRRFDANGRRVDFRLHSGRYVVPADHVFLLGESANSWDSRYWGSVARSTVAGRWVPLYLLS